MRGVAGHLLAALGAVLVLAVAFWGALALSFTLPWGDGARLAASLAFLALALGGLVVAVWRRRPVAALAPFALAALLVLGWWSSIEPSNDREWQPDVARLPSAEIDGSRVTLRNVRGFRYRSASDFDERWHDRTVDLDALASVDLITVYWGNDAIAHTMVSFGFPEGPVTISIETRKEVGEAYSTLAGFFRNYELYYVVADEEDVVGLRTTYREPPEDVYLYRVTMVPENRRRLFLAYLAEINALAQEPQFYNTLTTNCTTNIVQHIRSFRPELPLSWKMLLSGHFASLVYDYGVLEQSLPFADLRQRSRINDRARAADGAADFSRQIRTGLPGIPATEGAGAPLR